MGVRKGVRFIIGNEEMVGISDELWEFGTSREGFCLEIHVCMYLP